MAVQEVIDFIESEIQKRIKSFDERRKFYRKGAYRSTLLTSVLSALTTFCIGVGQIYESKPISIIALGTSASMTVLSAWDGFYSYRRRWIQTNDTLMKLYELDSDLKYKMLLNNSTLSAEEIEQMYKRYGDILRSANENWKEERMIEPQKE